MIPVGVLAESESGNAAQIFRETILKKDPQEESPNLGRLPKGTILTLKGNQRNGFLEVAVELEDGTVEGWIKSSDLNRGLSPKESRENSLNETQEGTDETEKPRAVRKKVPVPKDEGLLLRREASFFYGLQGGGNYSYLQSLVQDYPGIGFEGGAYFGFFLDENIPIRFEASYVQMNGVAGNGDMLKVGHAEGAVNLGFQVDAIEIFGALSYARALNINDAPPEIKTSIGAPGDLSSVYGGGGVGLRYPMSEITDFVARARFMMSFYREPVAFHCFALQLGFQFRG